MSSVQPPMRRMSADGVSFLTRHEGFRSHMYNDAAGHATVGYGHLVHRGPVGSVPASEAIFANGISAAMGVALLQRDLAPAEAAVREVDAVRHLEQHEFDALVSFVYNIGVGAFRTSTVRRYAIAGYTGQNMRLAFMMWVHPEVLRARRTDEVALYLDGRYHA